MREGGRGKMACLCPFHTLLKGTRSFYPSLSVILKYVKATMIRPSPLPFLPFLASSSLYRSQKCQLRSLFASWDLSPRDFLIFLSKWRSRGEGNSRRSFMVTMAYRTKEGRRRRVSFVFAGGTRNSIIIFLDRTRERMDFGISKVRPIPLFPRGKFVRSFIFGIGIKSTIIRERKKREEI